MDRLIERLPSRISEDDSSTIVHGDYRQENRMFAMAEPCIIAVLEWELSTIGHPLSDLAYFCLFYHADFTNGGSASTIDFASTGIPRETELVAQYCAATGRKGIADWPFYIGFAAFRLAAVCTLVFRQAQRGIMRAGTAQGTGLTCPNTSQIEKESLRTIRKRCVTS